MEYIIVHFSESRDVSINGEISGKTNCLLEVVAGTHTISLFSAGDFAPCDGYQVEVVGTNPLDPKRLHFTAAR